MVTDADITRAAESLGRAANSPAKVILFGSRARGDSREDSDIDFLVIERAVGDKFQEGARLRRMLPRLGVGVDVVVTTNEEADYWQQAAGHMIRRALREGRVVYDSQ
ncbi:MAG: nucleotidyltransferase domain-containing protein [Solirubrobacterales bacterium]